MEITTKLVIKYEVNKYEPDKPYVLHIVDYGDVGDKLNIGKGHNGKSFPEGASERHETFASAAKAYWKYLAYVKDVIAKPKRSGSSKLWT